MSRTRDLLKFYRLSGATFYDCIDTMYQFIKSFLDTKISIFEEYGAFKLQWLELSMSTTSFQGSKYVQAFTKTRLFKYIENFTTKNWKFWDKNCNSFHIFAPNIDYGYSLEPPRQGGSNEYPQSMFLSSSKKNKGHPCKPQFYYIKVGFKGIKII